MNSTIIIQAINKSYTPTLFTLIVVLLLGSACGPLVPVSPEDENNAKKVEEGTAYSLRSPTLGFWTERQGVGPDWYKYSFMTHSLSSSGYIYLFVAEDGTKRYMNIRNYSKPQPKTTEVKLQVATGTDAVQEIVLKGNLYKGPTCFTFSPAKEVSCTDPFDVMVVAPRRPVPEFTLAPNNPSFLSPAKLGKAYAVIGSDLSSLDRGGINLSDNSKVTYLPNVYLNKDESRLKDAINDGFVQMIGFVYFREEANGKEKLIRPSSSVAALRFTKGTDASELNMDIRCSLIQGSTDYKAKAPFNKAPATKTYKLKNLVKGKTYGISICRNLAETTGATHHEVTLNHEGLPPLNTTLSENTLFFPDDLYLYIDANGTQHVFMSPGSLHWAIGREKNVKSVDDQVITDYNPGKDGVIQFVN